MKEKKMFWWTAVVIVVILLAFIFTKVRIDLSQKSSGNDLISLNHKVNIADSVLQAEISKIQINVKDSLFNFINDYVCSLDKQQEIKYYEYDSLIRVDTVMYVYYKYGRKTLIPDRTEKITKTVKISKENYQLLTLKEIEEKGIYPIKGRIKEPSIDGLRDYISPYKLFFDGDVRIRPGVTGMLRWGPTDISAERLRVPGVIN